jgi:hypothetical protein
MTNYVKSFFAGMLAAVIYVILFLLVVEKLALLPVADGPPVDNGSYSSSGPWIPLWPLLIGTPLFFAAAFYWTLKRVSKAGKAPR